MVPRADGHSSCSHCAVVVNFKLKFALMAAPTFVFEDVHEMTRFKAMLFAAMSCCVWIRARGDDRCHGAQETAKLAVRTDFLGCASINFHYWQWRDISARLEFYLHHA